MPAGMKGEPSHTHVVGVSPSLAHRYLGHLLLTLADSRPKNGMTKRVTVVLLHVRFVTSDGWKRRGRKT